MRNRRMTALFTVIVMLIQHLLFIVVNAYTDQASLSNLNFSNALIYTAEEDVKAMVKSTSAIGYKSNGYDSEHPTWVSRQYEPSALCSVGKYLYTGSHLGFKKWDISIASAPVDVTASLKNKYLTKNQYIDQWAVNPWGTGGGIRTPYQMEYYKGYIYACMRSGSGYVGYTANETTPNTNAVGETENNGTVGYFMVMDEDLNVIKSIPYYGTSNSTVGYRKPSGFSIDEKNNLLWLNCQLYGWILYDISDPKEPVEIKSYSPLDIDAITSINGAALSSICDAVEYQNGEFFEIGTSLYYAVAGYADGIHLWDLSDIHNPNEIGNEDCGGNKGYSIFWRLKDKFPDSHVFDLTVDYPYMYCTIAPLTNKANDDNRISGLLVLDITSLTTPLYKISPIAKEDWNFYQRIGDVKPSKVLKYKESLLVNNGNKGVAVYHLTESGKPVYIGCISSDGDDVNNIIFAEDGKMITGAITAPYNFRIYADMDMVADKKEMKKHVDKVVDDDWEIINEFQLKEDVNSISIDRDLNGNSFELKAIRLIIMLPSNELMQGTYTGTIHINGTKRLFSRCVSYNKNAAIFLEEHVGRDGLIEYVGHNICDPYFPTVPIEYVLGNPISFSDEFIYKIGFSPNSDNVVFPSGTQVKLFGRRK